MTVSYPLPSLIPLLLTLACGAGTASRTSNGDAPSTQSPTSGAQSSSEPNSEGTSNDATSQPPSETQSPPASEANGDTAMGANPASQDATDGPTEPASQMPSAPMDAAIPIDGTPLAPPNTAPTATTGDAPPPPRAEPTDPSTQGSVFPAGVTRPRIMIVGDSISAGPGCYKKYLDQELQDNGITNYEFVGEYDDDCGGGIRHSAVSCTNSGQYTEDTFTVPNCFAGETFPGMAQLVATHEPDLIMVQLGVNDVWGGSAPVQPIIDNYATLVEQARAHNPNIVMVVAQIHRIITDNCTNTASTDNAEELVMAVPGWAAEISTTQSPVFVADLWTNSDPQEADDCVHPNDAGARRMGGNWFNALKDILP